MSTAHGEGPDVVMFTTGPQCTLCEKTWSDLLALHGRLVFRLRKLDLARETDLSLDYALRAPVVHADGRIVAEGRIDPADLERALRGAGGVPR